MDRKHWFKFTGDYAMTFLITFLILTTTVFAKPYLIGGSIAENDVKSAILNIVIINPLDEDDYQFCSATKISDTAIITAAHCVYKTDIKKIGFSNSTHNPELEFIGLEVLKVVPHPSYRGIDAQGIDKVKQVDVALILVKARPEFSNLQSMKMNFSEIPVGIQVEIWGFGCQKSLITSDDEESLKKFGTSNTLSWEYLLDIGGNFPYVLKDISQDLYKVKFITSAKKMDSLSPSLCDGDSGGPVLVGGELVGVNSTGVSNDLDSLGKYTSGIFYLNLHSRISNIQDWIEVNLKL